MSQLDFLVVGLGNPGTRYEKTRHNAGFMALEHFASSLGGGVDIGSTKFEGLFCRVPRGEKRVVLLKPGTYMNLSGQCVVQFVRFFKIPLANVLILHDDLDKDFATVKAVARGGAGGHNGIRSLIQHLGTRDFARVKIGIGHPGRKNEGRGIPVERYVLTRFAPRELVELDSLFSLTDQAIELFLDEGIDACMNQINQHG